MANHNPKREIDSFNNHHCQIFTNPSTWVLLNGLLFVTSHEISLISDSLSGVCMCAFATKIVIVVTLCCISYNPGSPLFHLASTHCIHSSTTDHRMLDSTCAIIKLSIDGSLFSTVLAVHTSISPLLIFLPSLDYFQLLLTINVVFLLLLLFARFEHRFAGFKSSFPQDVCIYSILDVEVNQQNYMFMLSYLLEGDIIFNLNTFLIALLCDFIVAYSKHM